jgi:methionyl-tRNA formyltransferase
MTSPKKFLFIGNRPSILNYLLKDKRIDVVKIFIPSGCNLFVEGFDGVDIIYFDKNSQSRVIDYCRDGAFDVCLSAGCPVVLPRSSFPTDKIFINSHPSALPYGKGIHPINECIFSNHKKMGSTLHYLIDELDAGNVISQEVLDVTCDIDLSLLYAFIFELEKKVVIRGLDTLFNSNFMYGGTSQKFEGSYYSRKDGDMAGNACDYRSADLVTKVKAYSSKNLGFKINANGKSYKAFNAEVITNSFVLNWYSACSIGDVVHDDNSIVLIRTIDGLVRLNSWIVI